MKSLKLTVLLLATFALSCATSTQIIDTWVPPDQEAPVLGKTLVLTVSDHAGERKAISKALAAALKKKGVDSKTAVEVFPFFRDRQKKLSADELEDIEDQIKNFIDRGEFKNAMVVRPKLFQKTSVGKSTSYNVVHTFYSTALHDWVRIVDRVVEPGVVTVNDYYNIRVNLFDLESEKLIWRTNTVTKNPSSLSALAKSLSKLVVASMESSSLLPKKQ